MSNGREIEGIVEYTDERHDLAIVKVEGQGYPTLSLAKSCDVRPGEWVVAMGAPLSLSNTITAGVVSSTNRRGDDIGLVHDMKLIQTDAGIDVGNSGGPLVSISFAYELFSP